MDLAPSDVHVPSGGHFKPGGPTVPPTVRAMSDLTTTQRKSLPRGQFADPAERKYPIHDKAHADNAAARLEQQKGSISPGKYARIKSRIKAAQRRFGEKPAEGKSMRGRGTRMSVVHPDGTRVEVRHLSAGEVEGLMILPPVAIPPCE